MVLYSDIHDKVSEQESIIASGVSYIPVWEVSGEVKYRSEGPVDVVLTDLSSSGESSCLQWKSQPFVENE